MSDEHRFANKITLGILADVDAGKTTLSEEMLYRCGSIRKLGRVDHGDTHLDTHELERAGGITIFSSQASFSPGKYASGAPEITLLDTPGHADFFAETERTLCVLDYAVLVISASDGVRSQARILWRLLKKYAVPVFIFVNKTDLPGFDKNKIMEELKTELDASCVDFCGASDTDFFEEAALCDESLLDAYIERQTLSVDELAQSVSRRRLFPCFFGSALKGDGIDDFLSGFASYLRAPEYGSAFSARVYRIGRDSSGQRLTFLKVTGGTLRAKQVISAGTKDDGTGEKADQIRLYFGDSYETVREVPAGTVCAVTGLTGTKAGQGLGDEPDAPNFETEAVLTYSMILPDGLNTADFFRKMQGLIEELPGISAEMKRESSDIEVRVTGEMQLETLGSLIRTRFGMDVRFGEGSIIYKETVGKCVEGVGHFEPLRHYAEVHLIIEPLPRGEGIEVISGVSTDRLDGNYQGRILTSLSLALSSGRPLGVLTGSPLTDIRVTLADGRAHSKHTEGGDLQEAALRALRQGLMKAECVLLEPYYEFTLELPPERVGRAMSDLQRMSAVFTEPNLKHGVSVLRGSAPAAAIQGYAGEVREYTRGAGRLFLTHAGFRPCADAAAIIEAKGYDPDADPDYPTGSIFCAHGAGFFVPRDEVENYMHLPAVLKNGSDKPDRGFLTSRRSAAASGAADQKELKAIFERTYGPIRRDRQGVGRKEHSFSSGEAKEQGNVPGTGKKRPRREYLLVDGYNIIFAWDDLKQLSRTDLEAARGKLMDILCDLQGALGSTTVILVFDAYKVEGGTREIFRYHNIHVVYTKEAETADMYIEKTVHELGRHSDVTVATSDALEQVIILGEGARRMSARGLKELVEMKRVEVREAMERSGAPAKAYMLDEIDEGLRRELEGLKEDEK